MAAPTDGANGTTPYDLLLADVDGAARFDLVMSSTNYQSGLLSLALGVGDGTFGAPVGSLAVANPGFLRPGSWGGTPAVQVAVTGAGPTIHVVDVNPEGFDDLTRPGCRGSTRTTGSPPSRPPMWTRTASELYLAMDGGLTQTEGIQRLTDLTAASPSKTWVEGVAPGINRMVLADIDGDSHLDLTVVEQRSVNFTNQYWLRTVALPGRSPSADPFGGGVQVDPGEGYCPDRVEPPGSSRRTSTATASWTWWCRAASGAR